MQRTIPCGRLFDIPIHVHVMLPAYCLLTAVPSLLMGNLYLFCTALVLNGPVLFVTVLVHEMGHAMMATRLGGVVDSILLWPLGGLAYVGGVSSAKDDLLVTLAGPITHIPMGVLWWLALKLHLFFFSKMMQYIAMQAIYMNFLLFAFNLFLPVFPMDGGRLLVNVLMTLGMQPETTAKTSCVIGGAFLAGMGGYGIMLLIGEDQWGVMWIMIAVWLGIQLMEIWRAVQEGRIEEHPSFSYRETGTLDSYFEESSGDAEGGLAKTFLRADPN